ncbi:GntR family transcriptional regulator [Paraburkholderia tagetis]|uniref:GntR family transcriptional regulator n=1 Tax=Paraburkholderia tagetis TaxID=2913261 RepID=A0A9X1UI64_9BURK|nr:GntR family transcriptional regulator [Paraburkholderia tagetis]MCG5077080.1 GntR family transcriptional regulator [Paraburkholderia tagetis]
MQDDYFKDLYAEFEAVQQSSVNASSKRLSENLAYVIRKAILSGVLQQGMPIRERVLAQELNVSRTPVREALFVLQGEGLVTLNHNRSGSVAHFSAEDIRNIYTLRGMLEGFTAECAAKKGDAQKIEDIRQALGRYQQLNADASCIAQAQADLEFHEAICAASGSQMLMTITRQVLAVTITHRSRYAYTAQQLAQAQTQHESIFNAIATGDYALAKWLMSEHVSKSSELAMQHLASGL